MFRLPHSLLLLSLSWVALFALSGCGDAGDEDDDFGLYGAASMRTPAEDRLAEELEGLLPGQWRVEEGADRESPRLNITFLGHDAVTGDIALLIGGHPDDPLRPARVLLSDDTATLRLTDTAHTYHIERLDDDSLSLVEPASDTRIVYQRAH